MLNSFNPYSPGFSIYLLENGDDAEKLNGFNPYSPGFSIYLALPKAKLFKKLASILIHLDFLSIQYLAVGLVAIIGGFNPYSPGFSIYFKLKDFKDSATGKLQSLFTWIFYLFSLVLSVFLVLSVLQSLFTWIFYLFRYVSR